MLTPSVSEQIPSHPRSGHPRVRRDLTALGTLVAGYGFAAYLALPFWWHYHARKIHLPNAALVTHTRSGIPGDPINVALVGDKEQIMAAMRKAGWDLVDRTTLHSRLKIAESVMARRPYPTAPVSNLYLFGRRQDLAFERQVGHSARQRHHVRFWRSSETMDGRPVWLGAATFDRSVGFSHRTGQITHHIAADIDKERNVLVDELKKAGALADESTLPGIGPTQHGKNGGGDRYVTDGKIGVGVLRNNTQASPHAAGD